MKSGSRALGVAESYRDAAPGAGDGAERGSSTLAGAVVRADRAVDGFAFASCAVGGTDATDAVIDVWARAGREDVRFLLVAGVAPAWYNLLDLDAVHDAAGVPVLSVSFEESRGLEPSIRREFDGEAREWRLARYRSLPPRREVAVNDDRAFVRAVGCDDATAREVVRAFTPEGGRPEPLRVARLAARGADEWRRADGHHADGHRDGDS